MKSHLWSKDSGEHDEDWTASIGNAPPSSSESANYAPTFESPPRPPSIPRAPSPDLSMPRSQSPAPSISEILPRLDAPDSAVERLTSRDLSSAHWRRGGFPGWLEGAAGDPHSTMGQTAVGRVFAFASCPRPMRSFRRRSVAWGFARLRQRGSSYCAWDWRQQSVCQLDSCGYDWFRQGVSRSIGPRHVPQRYSTATDPSPPPHTKRHRAGEGCALCEAGRLSQTHSVVRSSVARTAALSNSGRSRGKPLSFRRCRLARTLWIADSCA